MKKLPSLNLLQKCNLNDLAIPQEELVSKFALNIFWVSLVVAPCSCSLLITYRKSSRWGIQIPEPLKRSLLANYSLMSYHSFLQKFEMPIVGEETDRLMMWKYCPECELITPIVPVTPGNQYN